MTHVERELLAAGDLAQLREEGLRTVLLGLIAGLYVWIGVLYLSSVGFGPLFAGPALTVTGLAAALVARKREASLSAAALIVGLALGILSTMWLTGPRVAPYLLAMVVSLTGLFFSLGAVLAVTAAVSCLVVAVGWLRFGFPPYSAELLAPVVVIGTVGILSALSVRNLYSALYWAWDRTMAAQRNEKELRERRAELARTAKALDEACQRLEYLNYDLARARQVAEEARFLKQQFATNISHELRTPLNVIIAFAEMMHLSPESYGGVPLPPEYRGDVQEIYRASQHLLSLIDDVLELSRIEGHQMRLQLEPSTLVDVVTDAVETMQPLVRGKGIHLGAELPPDLPPVLIDRARVRQVLLNLLNNARRFTDRGQIIVRVAREERSLRVTVEDTGIGIAPADQEKAFEEFRQLGSSIAARRGGTGLGLTISRRFVEMHGGRIWVESEGVPGRGSRFHFTLPLGGTGPVGMAGLHRTAITPKRPHGRGRTILLVGRDAGGTRLLEQGLAEYEIVSVSEVAAAAGLVEDLHPQAVLLNTSRGSQAWRQLRQLRRRLANASVPIVALPLVDAHRLAQELGVGGYLVKPISRTALTSLFDQLGYTPRCVLVVDDDARMARVLSRMIKGLGREIEVICAYDGAAGLHRMERDRPDLVLLDLLMPGMDGGTVLARMHQDPALCGIPVVVVTAQEPTPDDERQLTEGLLMVANEGGFSNDEVLLYLQGILAAVDASTLRQCGAQAGEHRHEVTLGHRLLQVGGGAQ